MLQVTPVVVAMVKAIVNEDVDRAFSTYTGKKVLETYIHWKKYFPEEYNS